MMKICLYPGPMFVKSIRKLSKCFIKATKGIIFHFEKCHITLGGGGGEVPDKCHQMSHGGGGVEKVPKKCHVLFE
jgi:hypothetical protein